MANLSAELLLGSARLEQHLNQKARPQYERFGIYQFPSIITTNEPTERNLNSFAHRHYPHAIDYSDPCTYPPLWRKQVMLPFPPPPGYIQRDTYGISVFDWQTKRIRLQQQLQAEDSRRRSQQFVKEQEAQRIEHARVAQANRRAKVMGAMSKMGMGCPLTLEERYLVTQDAYEQEKTEIERETAGLAGAEIEARKAAKKAAAIEAEQHGEGEADFQQGSIPDEETMHYLRRKRNPHRVYRNGPNVIVQVLQPIICVITFIWYLLSCPDGFRSCPCGLIKRPYRFVAHNPALVPAVVSVPVFIFWEEVLEWIVWALLRTLQISAITAVLIVRWIATSPKKDESSSVLIS
ncbi:MAG: hypothetical protein Q9170_000395 [Blastenia crenularia]